MGDLVLVMIVVMVVGDRGRLVIVDRVIYRWLLTLLNEYLILIVMLNIYKMVSLL